MKLHTVIAISLLLSGCASPMSTPFNPEQQLRLNQIIHDVAKRQQVGASDGEVAATAQVLFSAGFTTATTSLLNEPALMPAVLTAPKRSLVLVISVAPGPAQLQQLSHGMRLSLQLQQFLQDQQFNVRRTLKANATENRIELKLSTDLES